MILRSSAAPHICLSCRRALVSRNTPWKSIWTSYSTAQPAPILSEAPRNHAKKFPKQYPPRNEDGNIDQEWLKKELASLEKSKPAKKKQEFRNERGESFKMDSNERESLFRKRGHKKRQDYESLSMPILGQDGKVLVLRDSVVSNYYATSNRTLSKPAAHIDIIDQMDEERGLPGESEVMNNIEVSKPKPGQEIHTWDEVSELVGKLQNGFKTPQLRKYIDTHKAKIGQAPLVGRDRGRKQGTIATPWRPGIPEFLDYFDNDPLRGYVLDSYSRKQRTILQLLIECWDVEALEISEGIGQFEIEVCNPKDLDLLLAGPTSELDKLYTERLNLSNEKLEVLRSRNVIRVTTAATKRDWILEGFHEIVSRLRREKIQLEAYGPVTKDKKSKALMSWVERTFDERTLKKVADLIRIDLTWSRERNTIEVAAIERTESGKPDYRWHAARRLLMMPSTIMDRTKHRIAIDIPFGNRFVPYTLLEGLNWWAQLRKWTRCTAPVSKVAAETPSPESKELFLGKVLQARSPDHRPTTVYRDPAEALPRSSYKAAAQLHDRRAATNAHINGPWAKSHFTKTTATFGAVLHGYHPTHPVNHGGFDLLHPKASPADSHEFSTHVPNLSRFISHTSPISADERPGKKLVLRFRPDPFTKSVNKTIGGAALHDLPTIEMHFSIGPEAKKTLKDVYAIVGEERTDVMLPQNAVDVRFTQKTTSRWKKGLGDNMLSQFDQYIKKCGLDGKRMEIFPTIQIPITPELCVGKGLGVLQPLSTPKQSKLRQENFKDPRKTRMVPYLFANLEVRQRVVMKFQGWTVMHTSVEAGKTGGRRDELTLTPMKGAHMASEEEFVAMAYNIANVLSDSKPDIRTRAVKILKKTMSPLRIRRMVSENEDDAAQMSMYFSRTLAMQDAQENEDERLIDDSDVEGEKGSTENDGERLGDDLGVEGEKGLTESESGAPVPAGSAEDDGGSKDVPPEDQRDHGDNSHNSSGGYYMDRD